MLEHMGVRILASCLSLLLLAAGTAEDQALAGLDEQDATELLSIAKEINVEPGEIELVREGPLFPADVLVPVFIHRKQLRVRVEEGRITGLHVQKALLESTAIAAGLGRLEELHLMACSIKKIEGLEELKSLRVLNLNFNDIKTIQGLEGLESLEKLVLTRNDIKSIGGLSGLTSLRKLFLTSNDIKIIEGLEDLVWLSELYLGGNRISQIQGLDSLGNLRLLVLYGNKLKSVENLGSLTLLEELYLSSNAIKKIEGLEGLENLRQLHLNSNGIKKIQGLDSLASLEVLDLSDNKLRKVHKQLESLFETLGNLKDLRLHHNPIKKKQMAKIEKQTYMRHVSLKPIDYTVRCDKDVQVEKGKSYGFYAVRARHHLKEGNSCTACAYYLTGAQEHDVFDDEETDPTAVTEVALGAALCTMELHKNAPAAIKLLASVMGDEESRELADFGAAEATRRCGRLKGALGQYESYLEDHPKGPHAGLARLHRATIYKFFQTNDVAESAYHKIRRPAQLVFFDLEVDDLGNRYIK